MRFATQRLAIRLPRSGLLKLDSMPNEDENPFNGKSDEQIARIGYEEAASLLRWVAGELAPGKLRTQLLRRAAALDREAQRVGQK